MSLSVLYDAPGPRTIARHRVYSVATVVALVAFVAFGAWKFYDTGQFAYDKWEPLLTPAYIEALLVDGLLKTLQMAFLSIVFAVIFGLVFGMGKLSDHSWVSWPCWVVVEFFRAVPLLLLIIFIFVSFGVGDGIGSFWSVVVGLTLYNGAVLAEASNAMKELINANGDAVISIFLVFAGTFALVLIPVGYAFGWLANRLAVKR